MRWPLIILILLGVWWRTAGLFDHTFFADEALFAGWARLIAVWRDPLLATVLVDKPPLLFYLQAVFYPLQGAVGWAPRMPNWIGSICTMPLVWLFVRRQVPSQPLAAAVALLLLAFSPLAIQFSATAFTDPLLVTWLMLAAVLAINPKNRVGSPLAAGLALWTKYQAVLFFPLLWLLWWRARENESKTVAGALTYPVVIGAFAGGLVGWDVARSGRFSLWSNQMRAFGGVRPAWSWEVWPRLVEVSAMSWWIMGVGWLVIIGGAWAWWRLCGRPDNFLRRRWEDGEWIGVTIVGYLTVHWLLAIPIWDRYWLPLVPWLAIWVSGRFFSHEKTVPTVQTVTLLGLMTLLLLPQGMRAGRSEFPVGGSSTADGGAAEIAAFLIDKPYGTVLYDHFYSWHWRTAFFDTGVFVSWFPSPEWFGRELQVFGDRPGEKYVVLPTDSRANPIRRTASETGFTLVPVATSGEMTLYRMRKDE